MKKLKKGIIAVVVLSSLLVTPVFAVPSTDGLEQKRSEAETKVKSLQSELKNVLIKMDEIEEGMANKNNEIDQAEADLVIAEEKQVLQYDNMKLRIKYMYEEGNTSFLENLVTAKSITEFLNKAEYVQSVHKYDRDMLQEFVDTKEEIAGLQVTLQDEMKVLATMAEDFDSTKRSLASMIETKRSEVADFDQQLVAAAAAAAAERQLALSKQTQEAAESPSTGNKPETTNPGDDTAKPAAPNPATPVAPTPATPAPPQPEVPVAPTAPEGNVNTGQAIVNGAYAYIGTPYQYGGQSFSGIDCSGLTMRAHQAAGISIARTSGAQSGGGKNVGSLAEAQPGDLIGYPGHVAIYIGGNQVIHAPQPGQSVKVASVFMSSSQPITAIRRYW